MSRKTASKYYKECADYIENPPWEINDFHNEEDNKFKRALKMFIDLADNMKEYKCAEVAEMLGVNARGLKVYYDEIYGSYEPCGTVGLVIGRKYHNIYGVYYHTGDTRDDGFYCDEYKFWVPILTSNNL